MSERKRPVKLAYTLAVVMLVAGMSACRAPNREKLPVCPGDPRCENSLI